MATRSRRRPRCAPTPKWTWQGWGNPFAEGSERSPDPCTCRAMEGSSSSKLRPLPAPADLPELMQAVRARTPARILVGRAGPSYRTATQLELRQDHAAAVDAVQ